MATTPLTKKAASQHPNFSDKPQKQHGGRCLPLPPQDEDARLALAR
jgi:hypothetical protein